MYYSKHLTNISFIIAPFKISLFVPPLVAIHEFQICFKKLIDEIKKSAT